MAVELNHTLVHARDREASAAFLANLLGLKVGARLGPFIPVETSNGVTLDFLTDHTDHTDHTASIAAQHYAFLVPEDGFDAIFARIERAGVTYTRAETMDKPGEIYRHNGGRGLYFLDPDGHAMEILTQPYVTSG